MNRLVLIIALLSALVFAGTAFATEDRQYVYSDGQTPCVELRASITAGDSAARVWGWGANSSVCGLQGYGWPAGYIAVLRQTYVWAGTPSGGEWQMCSQGDWQFNSYWTNTWGTSAGLACGSNWYGTVGNGYVWRNGWRGGGLWSGYTYAS